MRHTCQNPWCENAFEVTDEDLQFLDAVSPVFGGEKQSLPPPVFCPECRYMQRLTWRNERNLYRTTCAATGKSVLSIFSPDKSWPPVYDQEYWWSDRWDAKAYGRDMDFSRPFFEQWSELFHVVPQLALNNQQSENCEYTNQSQRNKDCYLILCSNDSRDCMHGMWYQTCLNCVDGLYLGKCELCYDVVNAENCYRCTASRNIENCLEVHFSKNCIGCKHCVGCVNLRNKEYHLFNEKFTKDEYEKRLSDLDLESVAGRRAAAARAAEVMLEAPHKHYVGSNTDHATGDYLMNVREVRASFNCRNAEYLTDCQDVWRAHHCADLTETVDNNFSYSLEGCVLSTQTIFSKKFFDSSDALYCSHCNFSKHLFGCVGLNHGRYCILNKQYTKEDYEALAARIVAHMRETGEWGGHFPARFSPFGYNESVAAEYFPLSREEALGRGFRWTDYEAPKPAVKKTVEAGELPLTIADVPDDATEWGILCEATGKPFKIIKQELDFYRRMRLPLPRLHPDERHRRRMQLRNPRKLSERTCMECGSAMSTTYAPDRPETVLCEACYLKAVY